MRKRRYQKRYRKEPLLKPGTRNEIIIVFLFTLAGLTLLSYFNLAGRAGVVIDNAAQGLMGALRLLLPAALIAIGAILAQVESRGAPILGVAMLSIFSIASVHLLQYPGETGIAAAANGTGGGYLGLFFAYPLYQVFGTWATLIIFAALILISLSMIFSAPLSALIFFGRLLLRALARIVILFLRPFKRTKIHGEYEKSSAQQELGFEEHVIGREEVEKNPAEEQERGEDGEKIKLTNPQISKPARKIIDRVDLPFDLLDKNGSKPVSGDIRERQDIIQKTLENFGIDVEMGDVSVGPTVTQYTLRPSVGIKLSAITALSNDLSLALAAHPIRIEAPIPGKSLVGIEVPNEQVSVVCFREVLESPEWGKRNSPLTIVIGKDVAGKPWLSDLSRMPHLLVAGSTGSGKTVCLNSIILSLLYQNGPDDLRLILIDPKRVELPIYNGIPHLMTSVITDVKQTTKALRWAIMEMERRFEMLSKIGARDIKSYNEQSLSEEKMPYLVIIVDELADLMVAAASEVEGSIIRLAQMSRAVGIHLILATQRPSVEIITGLIKANITSRIAFSVASIVDSRTILDMAGAEKLLGRGDMLFITSELSKPKRLQGTLISDKEINRVVDFLKKSGAPEYIELTPQQSQIHGQAQYENSEEEDELLPEAKEIILQAGKASASLLQRRLKIGYARAARILDLLEDEGFIGPGEGAKPREILAPKE